VTRVPGDSEAEAADAALGEFIPSFQIATDREDDHLEEIFGNDRLTYCGTRSCDGCDLEVHVVRMENGRRPVAPGVLIFDLV